MVQKRSDTVMGRNQLPFQTESSGGYYNYYPLGIARLLDGDFFVLKSLFRNILKSYEIIQK